MTLRKRQRKEKKTMTELEKLVEKETLTGKEIKEIAG